MRFRSKMNDNIGLGDQLVDQSGSPYIAVPEAEAGVIPNPVGKRETI